ncbi:SPOR domain-containing protein [Pedobacter sp.]|uniref:SPOR domain-containing protein n=1 Tax=Pedobacter sp. TaxID=1411316 RepID=UPI0031D29CDF
MDILSYLLELLQQRKEVGITGLGTFYKKKYPGRYDKEKQTFLPPGYTLQFSTEVTEEEALAGFISARRNISDDSARYYIEQFVNEVNEKLELDHEIELEKTGRLFFTEQGLDFEPVKNINYGSEYYGLPALPETATEEAKTDLPKEEEEVYDEIAEAPVAPSPFGNKSYHHPVIENIELDEVKDDLKHTLQHSESRAEEITEAPDFIKEQHEEHPNRFGHAPESEIENVAAEQQSAEGIAAADAENKIETPENTTEQEVENISEEPQAEETPAPVETEDEVKENTTVPEVRATVEEPTVEVPESVVKQHQENPGRFGHTPETEGEKDPAEAIETVVPQREYTGRFSLRSETEEPKTYLHLEEEVKHSEPVIEAPAFIKEQHAEHPNRFGHDPILRDQEPQPGMSAWLKVTIVILILVIIAAITYLVKPEIFNGKTEEAKAVPAVIDSPKATVDSAKIKSDSVAKTDSVLKANQVQKKTDTNTKTTVKPAVKTSVTAPVEKPKDDKIVPNRGPSTFDVIAASYKTVEGAEKYIAIMKTRGINAKIANMAGPWKKVSIASFATEEEAKAQKEVLQKKLKGKGFYVQQIFNNTQPK